MRRTSDCPSCGAIGVLAAHAVVAPWVCELMGVDGLQSSELLDCPRCGLSFFSQRYDDEDMAGLYSEYRTGNYMRARQRWEPWYRSGINEAFEPSSAATAQRVRFLEDVLKDACGEREWSLIVDVGGDAGQFFPRGKVGRRVLIDPSNKPLPDGVERASSLSELGSPPDLVVIAHVLEHVTDPVALLAEVHGVLADDGRLYVEVPTDRPRTTARQATDMHARRVERLARHRVPFVAADFASGVGRQYRIPLPSSVIKQSEHINFFSPDSLTGLLRRAGFEVEHAVADPDAKPAGLRLGLLGMIARKASRMRVAEYVAARLHALGVDAGFSVVGGGAMFLNEAFGEHPGISMHYLHHEQSAAMAAEGYARIAGRPAAVVVTSGPGSINAMNGVFGAYTDSIAMIVVGGQVRRNTLADGAGLTDLRQLGDQEARVIAMVTPITKMATQLLEPNDAQSVVDRAWLEACGGRPGPVWIEIPVDVQGAQVDLDPLADLPALPEAAEIPRELVESILDDLASAQRPVILAGTGVRLAGQRAQLLRLAEAMNVPILTGWTHDLVPTDHILFAGRPGTIGTRAGNFVLQGCDHLLVLGSRLNIRQISYNWTSFAKNARITWVDIDAAELSKPFITPDRAVVADLRSLLPQLADAAEARTGQPGHAEWIQACRHLRETHEPREADYPISRIGYQPLPLRDGALPLGAARGSVRLRERERMHHPLPDGRPHGRDAPVQQQRFGIHGL